jgi:hypothetical protein
LIVDGESKEKRHGDKESWSVRRRAADAVQTMEKNVLAEMDERMREA